MAVLGYSGTVDAGLHPICADRLSAAERAAAPGDAVLLSGWARRPATRPEADLMRDAWSGPAVDLRCDSGARSTGENAAAVADHARQLGATEVLLVTSWWHAPRARVLVRSALAGSPVRMRTVTAARPPAWPQLLREAACLIALPLQVLLVRRARPSGGGTCADAATRRSLRSRRRSAWPR